MSRVLVVSRTRMNQGRVCVGGHDLDDDFRSLRLLTKAGMNIEEDADIDVGEVWELSYKHHPEPDPPHREDVLVSEGKKVDALSDAEVRDLILQNEDPWAGSPEALFDGTVAATANGRVYVPGEGPLPSRSTGYWLPDDELIKHIAFQKARYLYAGSSELNAFSWAGMTDPATPNLSRDIGESFPRALARSSIGTSGLLHPDLRRTLSEFSAATEALQTTRK